MDMGRKLGAVPLFGSRTGSPPNTIWPGPRPTSMLSFIFIRPTVWPQQTNVTDRQTGQDRTDRQDRQRSDSIGRTVLQTVAQKEAYHLETVTSAMNIVRRHCCVFLYYLLSKAVVPC